MPRIEAIALYEIIGRRTHVVAPNACTGIRPAEARENLLLLMTDDGRSGITNFEPDSTHDGFPDTSWMIGLDPRSLIDWRSGLATGLLGDSTGLIAGAASVDVALLDLCSQIESVPLWQLLGDEVRATVPAYDSTLHFEDLVDENSNIESVCKRAREAIDEGHRAVKIRVGRGLKWMSWPECTERDVEVCLAVRAAVGPSVSLIIDGNCGYSNCLDDAVDFVVDTHACGFAFLQELVQESEVGALKQALHARGIVTPLAGGVRHWSVAWCEQHLDSCPLDVLQLDMCRTGLLEYMRVCRYASERGLQVAPHTLGSSLAVYQALHLGKVASSFLMCECDDTKFDGYSAPGFHLSLGRFSLPETPGLGVSTGDPRSAPGFG